MTNNDAHRTHSAHSEPTHSARTDHDRRFAGQIAMLRSEQRVAMLEIERVVTACLSDGRIQSVLDIGTGSGLFAEAFAKHGCRVTGIDLREDMLEVARQFVPTGEFQIAHMEHVPLADKQFDSVFMGLVLHEADDVTNALREAHRLAQTQVAVLEWVYQAEDFGPPLAHRLRAEQITEAVKTLGFGATKLSRLTNFVLYQFS